MHQEVAIPWSNVIVNLNSGSAPIVTVFLLVLSFFPLLIVQKACCSYFYALSHTFLFKPITDRSLGPRC